MIAISEKETWNMLIVASEQLLRTARLGGLARLQKSFEMRPDIPVSRSVYDFIIALSCNWHAREIGIQSRTIF